MATYDRRAFNGDDVDGERRRAQVSNLSIKDENRNALGGIWSAGYDWSLLRENAHLKNQAVRLSAIENR